MIDWFSIGSGLFFEAMTGIIVRRWRKSVNKAN